MDQRTLKILTPAQRTCLDVFFAEQVFARSFYLTGGTALAAFYLFHRYSDDLDFFTNDGDMDFLLPLLQGLAPTLGLRIESRTPRYIRTRTTDNLQIDFVHDVPQRIGVPVRHGSWHVDTLENILVNKVTAIQGRLDAKDYVDLYLLLRDRADNMLPLLAQATCKDASVEPFLWSKVIRDVEQLQVLPRMITPVTCEELVTFYQGLRHQILTAINPNN